MYSDHAAVVESQLLNVITVARKHEIRLAFLIACIDDLHYSLAAYHNCVTGYHLPLIPLRLRYTSNPHLKAG